MKLLFKQRMFSWADSYDIYGENGEVLYEVKGRFSFGIGHFLNIFDANGNEKGSVEERIFSFLPKYDIYFGERYIGCIKKEFSLFSPRFTIDYNGWNVEGDFFEWDYRIVDDNGNLIATVTKELFNWTDTYVIDVENKKDALEALMLVLAIDAEKCSRK